MKELKENLPARERFGCNVAISEIKKGKGNKMATIKIEVSNEVADTMMRGIAGIGKKIYGPQLQWEEDK